jgi:hypothetical protein
MTTVAAATPCTELVAQACDRFDISDRLRLAAGLIDLALRDEADAYALVSRAQFIVTGIHWQLLAALKGTTT